MERTFLSGILVCLSFSSAYRQMDSSRVSEINSIAKDLCMQSSPSRNVQINLLFCILFTAHSAICVGQFRNVGNFIYVINTNENIQKRK